MAYLGQTETSITESGLRNTDRVNTTPRSNARLSTRKLNASSFCKLEAFNGSDTDNIELWLDNLQILSELNEWTEEEKAVIIQTNLHGDAKNFLLANPPLSQLSFREVRDRLIEYFSHRKTLDYHYFELNSALQRQSETVVEFTSRLRTIATKIVSASDPRNRVREMQALDKQLLSLLRLKVKPEIGRELRKHSARDFDEGVRKALEIESWIDAEKQLSKLQVSPLPRSVRPSDVTCYNCGNRGHRQKDCKRWNNEEPSREPSRLPAENTRPTARGHRPGGEMIASYNRTERQQRYVPEAETTPRTTRTSFVPTCYTCRGRGHLSRNCAIPRNSQTEN